MFKTPSRTCGTPAPSRRQPFLLPPLPLPPPPHCRQPANSTRQQMRWTTDLYLKGLGVLELVENAQQVLRATGCGALVWFPVLVGLCAHPPTRR